MNKYTYKHIIMALREEYLNIQRQLDDLKKYIKEDKTIANYRFKLCVNKDLSIPKLFLEFETKQKRIGKVLEILLGGVFDNAFIFDISHGFKERYGFNHSEECNCYFKISNEVELNNQITRLINSDYMEERVKNKEYILPIEDSGEKYFGFDWEMGTKIVDARDPYYYDVRYLVLEDYFLIRNNRSQIIDIDHLYDVLNYQVNVEKFDDYYKKLLSNSEEKEVRIDAEFKSFESYLSVLDTPKEYVLVNKK